MRVHEVTHTDHMRHLHGLVRTCARAHVRVLGIPRYTAGGLDVVAFDWGLRQAFPKRPIEGITPVASPGMGGGLFAIDRKLFFKLGGEYASAWCRAYAW